MEDRWLQQSTIWGLLRTDRLMPPGLRDVADFLKLLEECDGEVRRALLAERGHGTDTYPAVAMWRLLATKLYLRKGRFSDMLGELRRNADLAELYGFRQVMPGEFAIPSKFAISRLHKKLKGQAYRDMMKRVLKKTVSLARAEDSRIGRNTATDSTDVRTHGHAARHEGDPEKEKPSTDPEASWSVKTKRWEDAQGRKREETKSTFGYKACLNVDACQPVIIEAVTVTGSQNDQQLFMPVLQGAVETLGPGVMETCAADKGFDSTENVRDSYRDLGVHAIIPVRDVPQDLESKPAEDREAPLKPSATNVVRDKYTGEVACYEPKGADAPQRRVMDYAGFDKARECHKFRCPLGAAAATECSAFNSCGAGSCGKHGRQVRVEMTTDFRRFAPVYPRSKKWKRLYNGRSAVERDNSYLKEVLRLEEHCLRGRAAIELQVLLGSITLNLRTILAIRAKKAQASAPASAAA